MDRTFLFVPGHRADRFDKALASGADVVVVDLEDAVPADRKAEARAHLGALLARIDQGVAVRINGCDTPWWADDLAACAHPAARFVMVAKAEQPDALAEVIGHAPRAALLPLIETARGFADRDRLASAPHVHRLVFGSIDFQLDLGIDGEGDELLLFRSGLVLASRLACLPAPIDGVSIGIDDADALRHDSERARRLGFGGKLCIHPKQLATVAAAFEPSSAELAWATKVCDAAARSGGAAVMLEGSMVDLPVLRRAQAILAESEPR